MFDVERIEVPIETFLDGRVVRRFGEREHSVVVGVEHDGGRYVVKASKDERGTASLRGAIAFHDAVRHPAIVPLLHRFETPQGLALVYPWVDGEILRDGADAAVLPRDHPESPYQRLLASPAAERLAAVRAVVDAHVAVAAAGFAAVDLYDGSVIYDFDRRRLHLIDLDAYRPAPYVLEHDRQLGSTTFMAPEELVRGATIDERTTVFTLGRFGLVFLGCARDEPPKRSDFEGDDRRWDAFVAATRNEPTERTPSVSALLQALADLA